jgi:hypothetical protein
MSFTITPRSTSSKVLVQFSSGSSFDLSNAFAYIRLLRDGTVIGAGNPTGTSQQCWADITWGNADGSSYLAVLRPIGAFFVDTPNTTSSVTYSLEIRPTFNPPVRLGRTANIGDGNRSSIPTTFFGTEIL